MKKTRILAALICVMMVVCSLPMVASAKLMAVDYNAMGAIFGTVSTVANTSTTEWPMGMKFDFRDNFDATQSGVTSAASITYDSTNGMTFPAADSSVNWKYFSPYTDQWSPLAGGEGTGYTVRVKINAGGSIDLQACEKYSHDRSYVIINEERISAHERTSGTSFQGAATINAFAPGNDWIDVVVTPNGAGYSVYAKKATESNFVLVTTAADYRSSGAWKSTGLTISGKNAYVSDAVMIKSSSSLMAPQYDSIEEIMGGPVSTTYSIDFNKDFDATNWTRQGALTSASVNYSDAEGLDMRTDGSSWSYYAFKAWSPLSAGNYSGDYIPQAVYLKMKGNLNVQLRDPSSGYRFYQDFNANTAIGGGGATVAENYNVTSGAGWMEYLIVPNASGKTNGFTIYAKNAEVAGSKWEKAIVTSNYRTNGSHYTGISFSNGIYQEDTGCVKSVRCYLPAVADNATIPADASYLWYGDEMTSKPAYGNLTDTNVIYDGVANFPATVESGRISYNLNYAEIPVGGYAEFKTRSNGTYSISVGDGETGVSIDFNKDYAEITGKTYPYMADVSNTTWRTWRIVRTEEGYNVYSKVDGDTAWYSVVTNASTTSTLKGIKMTFGTHQDGAKTGSGQVDYLKIYGAAPTGVLTLTDGVGTKVLAEGDAIGYGSDLRPIVNTDNANAKLLVVSYNGNDMIKAQIVRATELVDYQKFAVSGSGANKVKVFLWDATNMNRVVPAMTLTLGQ